jgi:hypothetical protein
VDAAAQGRNGYLRFTTTPAALRMEAVDAELGCVMDSLHLLRGPFNDCATTF